MKIIIKIMSTAFFVVSAGTNTSAQYCESNLYTIGCGSDEIASFYTTGGMSNISNINSGCDSYPLSHTYYPLQIHKAMAGSFVNFTIFNNIAFDEGFRIFADWNQDFDFDDPGEVLFTTALPPGMAASGSFQIPPGLQPGIRRLRIRCASAGTFQPVTNFAACDLLQYGEAEDYNIDIAPPCNSVTNLSMTTATSTTASFSWSPAIGSVGYQYATNVSGVPPAAGSPVSGTTQTVTALLANSAYYFHLRSKCSDSAYSDWTTMAFNTNGITTGVSNIQGGDQVRVYPNPARDKLFIHVENLPVSTIRLYDLTGRQVADIYTGTTNRAKQIVYNRNPDLANGLYFIVITTEIGDSRIPVILE